MDKVIEYRCLDCGKHYPYGVLAKERLDICPLCGYELVPVTERELQETAYEPGGAVAGIGITPSAPRLIGLFIGVAGLIFALAVWMPK